jgi:glycosyltransferase involved in cell wall biosynthesis
MKKSVVIFGNDPAGPTGFGNVTARIAEAVETAGAKPVSVALKADPEGEWTRTVRYPVPEDTDPGGRKTLETAIETESAGLVISVGDPWDLQGVSDLHRRLPFAWIGCTPVDATPCPRYILLTHTPQQYLDTAFMMQQMDRVVTFSRFGRKAVSDMLCAALAPQPAPPVESVYLGVDPDRFGPGDRLAARTVFQGAVAGEILLFTCIKVNSMRAGFDTLLQAWATYLQLAGQADPDLARRSRLYLHTNISGSGYPIALLMRRYGIDDSLLLNPDLAPGKGVPEKMMTQIHQATDIAVSATRAEGFGLSILEAMSCGIPCIVPDYGAPAEYGGRGVVRVPIAATYNPEFATTDFAIADPDRMAASMLALATRADRRKTIGDQGRKIAETMSWQRFREKWTQIIQGFL